ncbi:hypothetical protein Tco_1336939 [Tanacetum coccineum]
MEECFKALTYKLYWNNPEGDHCPFDLTKPLPLKGHPGRLTFAAEYFFNDDLEFLKSSDPKKKYTTSIMKTKVARYEIVGIEDMVPTLWSTIKVGYDKDAEKLFQLDGSDIVDLIMALPMDKKRSGHMVELIDKQMCERRIIRNLERLVGARELEMDYRLMTQFPSHLVILDGLFDILHDVVFVKSSADDTNVSIPSVERHWLSEAEGFKLPNQDTCRILPLESQLKVTDSLVIVTDSSVTDYDIADESLVCSTPLFLLERNLLVLNMYLDQRLWV